MKPANYSAGFDPCRHVSATQPQPNPSSNEKPGGSIPWQGESAPGLISNKEAFNLTTYSETIPLSHQLIGSVVLNTELCRESDRAPPVTLGGGYVCRRFHINPEIADLIAALAGLGNRRAA